MTRSRDGFALMAVLWVLAIAATVGLLLARSGRDAVGAARNRVSLRRAAWIAEGCAERARAAIDATLTDVGRADAWRTLDVSARGALPVECNVTLHPDDTRLDVNTITDEALRHLLREMGISAQTTDSLVDARADWCDADDTARELGAERDWYRKAGMTEPRNGPLASIDELTLVRGFAAIPQLDSVLAVNPGRIWLERAPAPVLAVLPGFTSEAVAALVALRTRPDMPPIDIGTVAANVSPEARRALFAHFQELATIVTNEPDAWVLTSRATSGQPAVESIYEIRLVRSGTRAAIVRRREWP
jgi:general secretion pathway protein K